MSDPAPPAPGDTLAGALFAAWSEQMAGTADTIEAVPWDQLDDLARSFWRSVAGRLTRRGALTLLEVPEGMSPEPADLEDKAVGDTVAPLSRAVRVLGISLGFVRDAGGALALGAMFTGNPNHDPDREVAAVCLFSERATDGLIRQIIDAAVAVKPMLAINLAAGARQQAMAAAQGIAAELTAPEDGRG